jgi:hypothetical protein
MTGNGPSSNGNPTESSRDAVSLLNSILELSGRRRVTETQIAIILDALAAAQNPDLVARFPAVLAICARRELQLPIQELLGRYWQSSPKRQNLEKLLYLSAALFRREGIPLPASLEKIAASLDHRYSSLLTAAEVQLSGGPPVPVRDMRAALQVFAGDLRQPPPPEPPRPGPAHLGGLLDRLFSAKQKELVFKKLNGQHLTKTEREYYSRVVKKKLAAVADPQLQALALTLCGPQAVAGRGTAPGGKLAEAYPRGIGARPLPPDPAD